MLRLSMIMLLFRSGIMRLVWKLMMDRRVPFRAKLVIPAAIVYLISPIDFIPDIVPFAGWIDDILALLVSTILFISMAPREVLNEYLHRGNTAPKRDGKVVDGTYRVIDDDDANKDKK